MLMTCVGCAKEFSISGDYKEPSEIEGCTFDCPHCHLVLVMDNGVVKGLHSMLHDTIPEWPEDGVGTNFIEGNW